MYNQDEEKKQKQLKLAICAILLLLPLIWTATGNVAIFKKIEVSQNDSEEKKQKFYEIQESTAFETFANVTLYGSSTPYMEADILSELDGKIAEILVNDGDEIKAGEVIAKLDERQYRVALEKSNAQYEKEEINLQATKKLYSKKLASISALAEAKANHANAKANLEIAKNLFENISISAPFSGKVENIYVEEGEVVSKYQSKIARLINNKIIIIKAYIPENRVMDIFLNARIDIEFSEGLKKSGVITYIADTADTETRTYLLEAELENPENIIKAGMTAKINIPTKKITVHKISPSTLALSDEGKVGVKYVDKNNLVRFAEVTIENEQDGQMLVSGMPDNIRIIVKGHGFLQIGKEIEDSPNE